MSTKTPDLTIHTRRFYRVVLEAIDPAQETPDSFAIKLAVKTRTIMRRARHIAHNVPYTVKSGLSATQANLLKAVLEEIGGIVRLENHFMTPGEEEPARETRPPKATPTPGDATFRCPSCGWEEPVEARFCSMCHRKFRSPERRPDSLLRRAPAKNPLLIPRAKTTTNLLLEIWARFKLPIVIGGAIILIFILLK